MVENKLSEAIEAFGKADKKNIKSIKSGDKIYKPDDYGQVTIGGISGGDDSGGDVDPHPSIGADYYPGSLADGEITERYLLYQRDESVAEEPTKPKTVTLLRDVGTKFNMAGDGATFLAHIQKTAMTAGAKGDVSDIELNYDEKNVVKDGCFTTTSYYPFYIKAADLATFNDLDIPINGIGENLSGKNVLAPHLKIKFNGDGTMTYSSVTGYDTDGNTTGANYEVVVDAIATFSVQTAVAQLPASVYFFNGSTDSDATLSGASDFYENAMDGLELNLESSYSVNMSAYSSRSAFFDFNLNDIGLSSPIRIPKDKLIVGLTLNNVFKGIKIIDYSEYVDGVGGVSVNGIGKNSIKIMDKSISIDISVNVKPTDKNGSVSQELRLAKVSTFKN
ncbi:hypothetical protein [Companilactobacillus muriivasis]|uniref:hypothetical protein n=1 Tax=Companilactobacillus muriivasis TaxID=3081444 RepID=UPI0030C6C639